MLWILLLSGYASCGAHDRPHRSGQARNGSGWLAMAQDGSGWLGTTRGDRDPLWCRTGEGGASAAAVAGAPAHFIKYIFLRIHVRCHDICRTHGPWAENIVTRALHALLQPVHVCANFHHGREQREVAAPRRVESCVRANQVAGHMLDACATARGIQTP
eukprot:835151-Prymnesium_polylepis.2